MWDTLGLFKIAAENDPEKAIELASEIHGVPLNLVRALQNEESGGKQGAISPKGARGRFQLMPDTARDEGVNPDDELENIWGGISYLGKQYRTHKGDIPLTVAAYNAGPGAVEKYGGVPPYKETRGLISRVLNLLSPSQAEAATLTINRGGAADNPWSDENLQKVAAQAQPQAASPWSDENLAKLAEGNASPAPSPWSDAEIEKLAGGGSKATPVFGEGDNLYDYESAKEGGLTPDATGHWASRVPGGSKEGLILKHETHPTFWKTVESEKEAGYKIYRSPEGRLYSFPADKGAPGGFTPYEPGPNLIPSLDQAQATKERVLGRDNPLAPEPTDAQVAGVKLPAQAQTGSQDILQANKGLNFVQRMVEPEKFPVIKNQDGSVSTHKMAWGDYQGQYIAYPTIIQEGEELKELSPDEAFEYAVKNKQFVSFPDAKQAEDFAAGSWKTDRTPKGPGPSPDATSDTLAQFSGPAGEMVGEAINAPFVPLQWAIKQGKDAIRPYVSQAFPKATPEEIDLALNGLGFVAELGLVPSYAGAIGKGLNYLKGLGRMAYYRHAPDVMFRTSAQGGLPDIYVGGQPATEAWLARKIPEYKEMLQAERAMPEASPSVSPKTEPPSTLLEETTATTLKPAPEPGTITISGNMSRPNPGESREDWLRRTGPVITPEAPLEPPPGPPPIAAKGPRRRPIYDLGRAVEENDTRVLALGSGGIDPKSYDLRNYAPEERRILNLMVARKGGMGPDDLFDNLRGTYPEQFGHFEDAHDWIRSLLDGRYKKGLTKGGQEAWINEQYEQEAARLGLSPEELGEVERTVKREVAAEALEHPEPWPEGLTVDSFWDNLEPSQGAASSLEIPKTELSSEARQIKRAYPDISDEQATILAQAPELRKQIAAGNWEAFERARTKGEIQRPLDLAGDDLFSQPSQAAPKTPSKAPDRPVAEPTPEPSPLPIEEKTAPQAQPVAPREGISSTWRVGNSDFHVEETSPGDFRLVRHGKNGKPNALLHRFNMEDAGWYEPRTGKRYTGDITEWDAHVAELSPEAGQKIIDRIMREGLDLGAGLGQMFAPRGPLARLYRSLRKTVTPEPKGDPNVFSKPFKEGKKADAVVIVRGDGVVLRRIPPREVQKGEWTPESLKKAYPNLTDFQANALAADPASRKEFGIPDKNVRSSPSKEETVATLNKDGDWVGSNGKVVTAPRPQWDRGLQEASPDLAEKRFKRIYDRERAAWLAERQRADHRTWVDELHRRKQVMEAVGEKKWGPKSKEAADALHLYNDFRTRQGAVGEVWNALPDEKKAVFFKSQQLIEGDPALKSIADGMATKEANIGWEALHGGLIKNVLEAHVNRLWDLGKEGGAAGGRKFGTKTGHARPRSFETIAHGWAEGKELKVTDGVTAQRLLQKEIGETLADKRFMDRLKEHGLVSTEELQGFQRLEHPNMATWTGSKGEKGTVLKRVSLNAPPGIAEDLNKVLGSSVIMKSGAMAELTRLNAANKALVLSFSLFHPRAFLMNHLTNPKKFWSVPRLKAAYQEGWRAITDRAPDVEKLVEAGLTRFEGSKDWQELGHQEQTIIGKALAQNKLTDAANKQLWKAIEANTDWIFNKMGNGYKFQYGLDTLDYLRKKFPNSPDEVLAQKAAEHANDVWGGLNEKVIGNNPLWVHMQRLIFLARDWTATNFRLFRRTFKPGEGGHLARRYMAFAFAKVLTATAVLNIALSLGDDKNAWERFKDAWRAGELRWLDVDITPLHRLATKVLGMEQSEARKYLRVGGHFYDHIKSVLTPVTFVHHKMSILGKYIFEAMSGTDWRGRPFTTLSEFLGLSGEPDEAPLKGTLTREARRGDRKHPISVSQIPSYVAHQARQSLPIPVQNTVTWLMGEMDGFDAVIKSAGAIMSSKIPTTEAQELMREISATRTPTGTPAQQEAARERYRLTDLGRKGKEEEMLKGLKEAVQAKKMTVQQAIKVYKDSLWDKDALRFKSLPIKDALRVYEVADENERKKFGRLLLGKFGKASDENRGATVDSILKHGKEMVQRGWVKPADAVSLIQGE